MRNEDVTYDFRGRVVVITGAGQGIGEVYAQYFARAGAQVVVAEFDAVKGAGVAARITEAGHKAIALQTDVADDISARRCVEQTIERYGAVDVLVNNAAMFSALVKQPFEKIAVDEWSSVLGVNATGTFLMSRAVAAPMRAKGYGRIINVSSTTVEAGRPGFLHYVSSKAAIIGMTRSMARELGPAGVTVNAIMPTLIATGVETQVVDAATFELIAQRQCIPRTGCPEDLAPVVMFLASTASGFITGQTIAVDGGAIHL